MARITRTEPFSFFIILLIMGRIFFTHFLCHSGCRPKSTSSSNKITFSPVIFLISFKRPKRLISASSPELRPFHLNSRTENTSCEIQLSDSSLLKLFKIIFNIFLSLSAVKLRSFPTLLITTPKSSKKSDILVIFFSIL